MNKLKQLNKKKWFIVLVILLAIALVGGLGTYAMFYWRSAQNTEITLKIGEIADVVFPNGQELNTNNLTPVFNYTDGEALTFSIKNNDTTNAYIRYTVNFNITNIDSALANTSLKYKLVSGNNVLSEGNFNNATSNSTIRIKRGMLSSGTTNFTFYLYIDGNIENDVSMMNKNIRGNIEVTAEELVPFNLAQNITNLYTNAAKTEVINNSITYNYATSVGLMNDRLGGTTTSLDGGNIRFYGAEETYLENSTGADGHREVGNWEATFGGSAPFSDSAGCNSYMQNNNITDETIAQETTYSTVTEFCSVTPQYYRTIKNYIDIGDKTEVTAEKGNWEKFVGNIGVSTEQECLALVENEGIDDTTMQQYYGVTISEFCSVTTIPPGTPILWRIIGVFDGKIRIRRDENIGPYSFDTSPPNINNGSGINEWSQADLTKLLNPGYGNNMDTSCSNCTTDSTGHQAECDCTENVLVNNSLWWNSQSGNCYNAARNSITACDFTATGLSEEAKEHVIDQTLYLGGFDTSEVYANQAFAIERDSNVWNSTKPCLGAGRSCNDTVTRTLSWTGKVGLIYPSDFGYAADFSNSNCQGQLSSFRNCIANWMSKGHSWTISPEANSPDGQYRDYEGGFGNNHPCNDEGAWPTLLLNSSVMALGTGSKDDPYVLQ